MNQIKEHTISKMKGIILYSSKMNLEEAINLATCDSNSLTKTLLYLQGLILGMKHGAENVKEVVLKNTIGKFQLI